MEEDDDWRQCAEWLNRCQVIPDDHPALGPGGNAIHLVQALMDGVALCHLLSTLSCNKIDIRSMKDFSPRPQNSQFLSSQNIKLFLQLCEKEFDIPKHFLVQPNDIHQAKNFGKAIALLSKLSHSQRAQLSGIAGFPPENSKLQTTHEYYNNLEEIAAFLRDKLSDSGKTNYTQMEEETKEKIYDTVVHQGSTARYSTTSEPMNARNCCIREIVETEKNYVDLLKMLIEKYKYPLHGVLTQQEIEEIFKYIEALHTIHRELLGNLSLATSSNVNFLSLSDVFLRARDQLLIYGEYCGHVQRAKSLVYEIMRNDMDKRTRIETCQMNSDKYNKFHLTELLTIPMQRVLKYHLLLEHLCKLTPADHPERATLLQAHEALRELALSINEVKRDLDTISAIDQIQSSLLDIELPPYKTLSSYGRLHMDGEVKVLCQTEAKAKIRYLFLFDKTLIVCKAKGESFKFMIAYHIINGPYHKVKLPTKKGDKYSFGFTLPIESGDKENPNLTFFTKSEELRTTWMKAVQTALSNLCPPGAKSRGYNFEMFTFQKPTYCCICNKLLLGIFFQGYRCRDTKLAAHKACLVNHSLPYHVVNGNMNGGPCSAAAPPPLPPQLNNTLRNRRSQLPMGCNNNTINHISNNNNNNGNCNTPVTTGSVNLTRGCSSASTISSALSQSESFDFSHLNDSVNSINQWLTTEQLLTKRNRRISTGLPASNTINNRIQTMLAVVVKPYLGEPSPPYGNAALCLNVGDNIKLLNWTNQSSWWRGHYNDSEGWFPASCVELLSMQPYQSITPTDRSPSHCFPTQHLRQAPGSLSGSALVSFRSVVLPNSHRHSLPPDCSDVVDVDNESWAAFDQDELNSKRQSLDIPQDCANPPLTGYDWYVGEMDRAEAVSLLNNCENGTFLVRVSKSIERMGEYSLTIVYGHPRHIRIQRFTSPTNGPSTTFGLCEREQFSSIPALIEHYSKFSLNQCFDEVDVTLLYPYQRCPPSPLFYVRANFNFRNDSDTRFLNMKESDRVAVISCAAEDRGWWKGWLNGRFGFFPILYVTRES